MRRKYEVLAQIENWNSGVCFDQVTIACRLAEDQWEEVMDLPGMLDLEIGTEMYDLTVIR